jgi:hypothetical protein
MKLSKENVILLILIIFALGFGKSVWWLPGAIGVFLLILSRFSWEEAVVKHLKTGSLVFILTTALFLSLRVSSIYSAEESATAATERNAKKAIADMSENTAEAYQLKMNAYVEFQKYHLSRGNMDSAAFCSDSIVTLRKRALAAQSPFDNFLRSEEGVIAVQTVSAEVAPLGTTFSVVADSLTRLDFVMNGGRTYKLVSNHRFKMKCSDGMFYDIPTELTWPIKEAGVFVPIVLANQELKLTITDVTDNM